MQFYCVKYKLVGGIYKYVSRSFKNQPGFGVRTNIIETSQDIASFLSNVDEVIESKRHAILENLVLKSLAIKCLTIKSFIDQYLIYEIALQNNIIVYNVAVDKIVIIHPLLFALDTIFFPLNKDVIMLLLDYLSLDETTTRLKMEEFCCQWKSISKFSPQNWFSKF